MRLTVCENSFGNSIETLRDVANGTRGTQDNQLPAIVAPATQWADYKLAKAAESAAKRKAEAFLTAWGVLSGEEYAANHGLTEGDSLELPVLNGNGAHVGKLTVSWRNPETEPRAGFWTKRLS